MSSIKFILHNTHEGRVGVCPDTDPNPPSPEQTICHMNFDQLVGLYDDIHESMLAVINPLEEED